MSIGKVVGTNLAKEITDILSLVFWACMSVSVYARCGVLCGLQVIEIIQTKGTCGSALMLLIFNGRQRRNSSRASGLVVTDRTVNNVRFLARSG